MPKIRNILICFGAFWASIWLAGLLQWPLDKVVNINAIVREETVLSGIIMGVLSSLPRTLAAGLAGVVVTLVVASQRPQFWALIVAALFVVDAPVRHHWGAPATGWDRLWQCVDLVFPALVCIAAAGIIAHLLGQKRTGGRLTQSETTI